MKAVNKILFKLLLIMMSLTSFSQPGRVFFHSGNKPDAGPTWQRIYVNFSVTDQSSGLGSKWNSLYGHPHLGERSIADLKDTTGANTGVGITTVATANWSAYSNLTANDNFSIGIGTYYPVTLPSHNIYTSIYFQYGAGGIYNATKPQFRITGLNPAKSYTLYMTCAELTGGFEAKGVFRVVGLTSPAAINVNGDVANQSVGATFTLQPTAGGQIEIWANVQPSGSPTPDLVTFPALVIVQN